MFTYIIRRILLMIPVLWGIATIVFLLMFVLVPGDPARVLLGQHGDERTLELIKQSEVIAYQEKLFGPIVIQAKTSLDKPA